LIRLGGAPEKEDPALAMRFSCPSRRSEVLKVGKSVPCVDEPKNGRQSIEGVPIGEQPIHRDGHIISVFPIVPQSGAGSLRPPLVMGSQAVDPFPVVEEWGTVAREHKSHIYLTEPDKALKVVG